MFVSVRRPREELHEDKYGNARNGNARNGKARNGNARNGNEQYALLLWLLPNYGNEFDVWTMLIHRLWTLTI